VRPAENGSRGLLMNEDQMFESFVRNAHAGAVYHFQTIHGRLRDPSMNSPSDSMSIDEDTRRNAKYFKWRNDKKQIGLYYIEKGAAWAIKKEIINQMWETEWFHEIMKFRNHSHQGFLSYLAEYQCMPENPRS
jgi:hypothetical protein